MSSRKTPAPDLTPEELAWLAAHPQIRYSADPNWPPFTETASDSRLKGIDILLLNELTPHLKSQFTYVPAKNWSEAVANFRAGKVDFLLSTARTEDRESEFLFTKPYFEFPVAIVSRVESPFLTTLDQLQHLKVAGPRNHVTSNTLRRLYPEIKLIELETSGQCLQFVAQGKADATVGNLVAMGYQIGELDLPNLKVSGLVENRYGLRYAIRMDWPELVTILDKALDQVPPSRKELFVSSSITPELQKVAQRAQWRRRSEWAALLGLASVCVLAWAVYKLYSINQRRTKREAELRAQREQLEQMVAERTAELTAVNEDLQCQVRERSRTEEVLRKSEEKFIRFFHSLPDGSLVSSVDEGVILDVNPAFCQCTGYSAQELIGRTTQDLNLWANPAERAKMVGALRTSEGPLTWCADFRRRDGAIIPVEFTSRLVEVDGRRCLIGVARELTEMRKAEDLRAQLEEQLRQAQKMEALGRLTGGVAHDFNNLLQVIQGNVLMLREAEDPQERELFLDGLMEASERAAALTRQLLSFSRGQPLRKETLDLDALLRAELRLIQRVLPDRVECVYDCLGPAPQIEGDRTQLGQVIMNLCVNARDAMPEGGRLVVELDTVPADEIIQNPHIPVPSRQLARLRVSDTGAGMSEETKARIFEPFFTTKGQDRGTGLGLAQVYGIVEKHGGSIQVSSQLGVGTTFTLYFPSRGPVPALTNI